MAAIADEIVAERPAVVGLQEVTRWTTYASYNPATGTGQRRHGVAYDFLDLLLDALADEGVVYEEVEGATASNFASPAIPVIPPLAWRGRGCGPARPRRHPATRRRDDLERPQRHLRRPSSVAAGPLR